MFTSQHLKYLVLLILPLFAFSAEEKWYTASDGSNYLIISEYAVSKNKTEIYFHYCLGAV